LKKCTNEIVYDKIWLYKLYKGRVDMKKLFVIMILLIFGCSSGISQSDYDAMVAQNKLLSKKIKELKSELSDDIYGEEDDKENDKKFIPKKKAKLPDKKKVVDKVVDKDYIGVWEIKYFVDDFGDFTDERYITNINWIKGKFSNSATENSKLNVMFLISKKDYTIKLFEYAKNNPLKQVSKYTVLIKDKNDKVFELKAENLTDRLKFDKESKEVLHEILMEGGIIKFSINKEGSNNEYDFKFQADGYDNVYGKL
jgi:hypothetical protein